MNNDATFTTSDLQQAIFLYISGVIYLRLDNSNPQRTGFVFHQPADNVMAAWQRGEDKGVRVILDAREFLKRQLGDR